MSQRRPNRNSIKPAPRPISRRKLWCFRLAAALGVPVLFFGLLELGLRLAGYGYPTSFLLNSSNHGQGTFVQNNQFGWRFFGPRAARLPAAFSIPREKPPGTIRIFVFGESAAYGDPQPCFGLPRMLEALLELRHPDKKFEVVNAAMTGINSHVILPLARDCVEAHADVWVIYMGNNEVVGPFGAGTVFGGQATPLPLIRAGLALKATRSGQLADMLRRAARKNGVGNGSWEGMRAFINYKLAESDPRLDAVCENFASNLKEITAAGRNSGAKVVLSTVAVNLKDCAPFASLHRSNLSAAQSKEWQISFDAGVKAQAEGNFPQAATCFDAAKLIDPSFAELRFRRAQCALALSDAGTAREEFSAARDLDALRFRCDTRLNEIIRQQAVGGIALADSERELTGADADGIPGADLFYEHVHLMFHGNYVLARSIAGKIEEQLGLSVSTRWPDVAECSQRLGYTSRAKQQALSDIHGRMADAPFTFQFNHEEVNRHLNELARQLPQPYSETELRAAQSAAEAALAQHPDDATLWEQLGEIKQSEEDYAGALAAVQRSIDLVPSSTECWQLEGILLAQENKYEEAVAAFKHVIALDPRAVWARNNLGLCFEKLGQRAEAVSEFKRTVALAPDYGTAWLALGQIYDEMGRTNSAQQCYATALANPVNQRDDLAALARFCVNRGWHEQALTNFAAAIALDSSNPGLHMEDGRVLAALGRHGEAVREYQTAVDLAPDQVQPHLQLGIELGRLGRPALAEGEFRQVLLLNSNLNTARANLGVALYEQGKFDDAFHQFEEVLQRSPADATALRYVQELRNRTRSPATQ